MTTSRVRTGPADASVREGVAFAAAAYGMWGLFPLYFKLVDHVPALEILLYRALWAVPAIALVVAFRSGFAAVRAAVARRKTRAILALTAVVISANWLVFTYAVTSERVLQSALGYYLSPLLSVAMGMAFLGERLNLPQGTAVVLAAAGVSVLAVASGEPPWIALTLALTFGSYGLLRKQVATDSATGLFIETALLAPFSLLGLIALYSLGAGQGVAAGAPTLALLVLGGPLTVAPLLYFILGARRLKLSTLGLMQYLTPTCHFLAAMAFGEPFTAVHAVTFGLIWTGLAVFTTDALARERRALRSARCA